mgnify:CR=1 FL=1
MRKLSYILEAWVILAWVDLRISATGYKAWRHYFNMSGEGHQSDSNPSSDMLRAIVNSSETAARHHWRKMNCLRRCIAQQRMLLRREIPTTLHVGVKKEGGRVKAHAWLSSQQRVINDSEDVTQRYQELQKENWNEVARLIR